MKKVYNKLNRIRSTRSKKKHQKLLNQVKEGEKEEQMTEMIQLREVPVSTVKENQHLTQSIKSNKRNHLQVKSQIVQTL